MIHVTEIDPPLYHPSGNVFDGFDTEFSEFNAVYDTWVKTVV
jgi:hypothetical protein